MDLNSRVDARAVANVDGRTYGRTYVRTDGKPDPISRHACSRRDKNEGCAFLGANYFL